MSKYYYQNHGCDIFSFERSCLVFSCSTQRNKHIHSPSQNSSLHSEANKLTNCSVSNTESKAILPLGPHGMHMQDYFSSFLIPCRVSPNCLNYRRLSISTAVDLSPRVRGSTPSGPDHLRKLLRRELENPSTRRAPKLLEDYRLPSSLFSKPPH